MGAVQAKPRDQEQLAAILTKAQLGHEQMGYIREYIALMRVVEANRGAGDHRVADPVLSRASGSGDRKRALFYANGDEMVKYILAKKPIEVVRMSAKILRASYRKWEHAAGLAVVAQAPVIHWPAVPTHIPTLPSASRK
jgi:hypothetical protein